MDKYLNNLLAIALANPGAGNAKLAACLVKRGRVLSYGLNSLKTHPLQAKFGRNQQSIHLHAEIDAIRNALRKHSVGAVAGSTLYAVRVLKDGTKAAAKPCAGCLRAVSHFQIHDVMHT